MLDLDCVATFLAVAACKGFREAGRQVGLSQPAVTQHIRRLEIALDACLIERRNDGCTLTPQGSAFLPHAERLVRLSRSAQSLFRRTCVVVGASSNVGTYLLQPYLKAFQAGAGRELQVVIGTNPQVAARLEHDEIDVGVMEWWDGRPGYVAHAWRREELVLIVPNGHRWAGLARISPDRLPGQPMLGGEPGSGTGRLLQQYLGGDAARMGIAMQLGSTEAVKRAVRAGLGISLVMASAVEEEARNGWFHIVRLERDPPGKDIFVIHRRGAAHLPAPGEEFARFLLDGGGPETAPACAGAPLK
ncbi:MAG TPA: LysR family transcriptional regulator [Noviherbaspirillum sp.]|jgi:DNA-binding transcriptional LysR family regulator|uniref:LysR family transcriptional regulator n=1 Tax=Noviherbaspirillum sp. TaxID=1926288 RepID=UPI002F945690